MNRNSLPQGLDGESLQTDVMRFMAIIAFCLIAILSLVRDVESQPTESTAEVQPEVTDEVPPEVADRELDKSTRLAEEPTEDTPPTLAMVSPKTPEPAAKPQMPVLQPLELLPPPEVTPPQKPAPTPPPVSVITKTPESQPEAEPLETDVTSLTEKPPESEGLTLRFVSDGDFLRLIAKGDVQVYAFQEREFLALGQNYEFYEAQAPKQIYEVLPETIPSLIDAALEKRNKSPDAFKWGISLPRKVERQIQSYLESVSAGQLLIDRYGEVHHVASR